MCELLPLSVLLYLLIGYAFGSIPFGLFIGKFSGYGDIRSQGSGNLGATNMLRIAGKKWALITLILDGLKGAIPVIIGSLICPSFSVIALLGAVLGHLFPIWLKFKGGKGVATTLGGLLALSPVFGVITCLTWVAMAYRFRYSSLSALVAVLVTPLLMVAMTMRIDVIEVVLFVISGLVWFKHKDNISRLLKREEPKLGRKKN